MKNISILDENQILKILSQQQNPFFSEYYAFYSSWFGGITTQPHMMLLPIDDHMVHRGDGVFEAMKAVDRAVYLLDEHMERLLQSAKSISLDLPFSLAEMKHIILETLRVANQDNAIIRIFLSRGPGNFSVNPYDSVGTQFYVIVAALKHLSAEKYEKGIAIGKSTIPVKNSWLAKVKSCNYLPNVMMKKEAVDRGLDFVVNFDEDGFVAEGATENIVMVNAAGKIVHPEFENILKGTTMMRAGELARSVGIEFGADKISYADLQNAREIIMCGTTLDAIPVVEFEGNKVGDGKVGNVARKLLELLTTDIRSGARRTKF